MSRDCRLFAQTRPPHLQFRDRLRALDPALPILVYCAGGFRRRKALPILQELGFQSIDRLHRGHHSWQLLKRFGSARPPFTAAAR